MKEQFYIDLKRREEAQLKWQNQQRQMCEPPVSFEEKLISVFEPRHFPQRECRPIVRRRTMEEVWKLLEEGFK